MTRSFISLLCFLVAGGTFFMFTKPAYDGLGATQAKIAEYDSALAKAKQLQAKKAELEQQERLFAAADLDRLQKMLPDHVDNVRLVLDLDDLASRHRMALQNVTMNAPQTGVASAAGSTAIGTIGSSAQKYDSLTLQFGTDGTYDDFMAFLTDLEASLRIVDLVTLTMTPATPGAGATSVVAVPRYHYDISIRTYWLK